MGVPVGIVESEHGFVLHYKIMWREQDVEVAQPLVKETQVLYPELAGCSFDKGFHSPGNRAELDKVLALNALPQKGKLSQAGAGGGGGLRGGGIRWWNLRFTTWSAGDWIGCGRGGRRALSER